MKTLRLLGAVAATAMVLFTSCLGEGSNTYSATQFAVGGISEKTFQTVLNTPAGPIYSAALEGKVVDGACYQVAYEVDSSSPENANANTNGYYIATVSALAEITKGACQFYNLPDTTSLLINELPLQNLMGYQQLGIYVDGHLFLGGTLNKKNEQQNLWTLYWDRMKDPVEDNGVNTYDLFIRVQKIAEGTGSSETATTEPRAFQLEQVLKTVNDAEKAKGKETYVLKVNYLTAINEKDSTDLKWDSLKLTFGVSE